MRASLDGMETTTTADPQGHWSLSLPSHPAGGPYKLIVKGSNTIEVSDVLVGDVWLASGQSNMEMPLRGFQNSAGIENSAAEIAAANYPQIRLMRLKRADADHPLTDLRDVVPWEPCTPESAATFSAVGYFFARDIYQHEHIPIGVIDSSWGGTPQVAWVSSDTAARTLSNAGTRSDQDRVLQTPPPDENAAAPAKAPSWHPYGLYNGMIAPLTEWPVTGVLWYQGESDTNPLRFPTYEALLRGMIVDWRKQWKEPDMPFLYVQLSSFGSKKGDYWQRVREAQRGALSLPYTGMAVTIDLGEEHQIHYAQKAFVGERLALLARASVYGEHLVANGPMFRAARVDGPIIEVLFDSDKGLKSRSGALAGFEIAGADKTFVDAAATIQGRVVVVSSPAVSKPMFVRYGWQSFAKAANLYNSTNLPASPFTSLPPQDWAQ